MSKLSFTVHKPLAADEDRASDKLKLGAPSSPLQCLLGGIPTTSRKAGSCFLMRGRKYEPDPSGDEDGRLENEFITSFKKFSAQRWKKPKTKAPTCPLVILSKPNPDWREAALKRRAGAARFIPDSAKASTGADGSVGGLGTRDTINSGPQLSGIQFGDKKVKIDTSTTSIDEETSMTVEEYAKERVPITAFGAAMLRGMGWVDGGAVTSSERAKKNALVEPYLPKSRPALLGIGAKEQEVLDDGSKKKKRRGDEKRYIPLVRQVSSREESRNWSLTVSRRASWSPERRSEGESSRNDGDRERRRDRRRDDVHDPRRERDRDRRDENTTVKIEETETGEMTGGEETAVERTVTGTWTEGTENAILINAVTTSGTVTIAIDTEMVRANREDGTDQIN
ncbi:DExH-box splicing factor binding site-domain-containing protein [Suillus subalutaceus]|uniref:DExH-box splicing factor binding site-domain-containing protein n=1 Tax=Suillus subalutaceus TaxID=48586 RepID=UPI001B864501|nr:DExH-box splicing factor binding site-domain-containing protein [Suillus subalutaceus]KAG1850200.1 DExH-box splicing factor binding site-domain-containing protein [Suillus subalutaceus]